MSSEPLNNRSQDYTRILELIEGIEFLNKTESTLRRKFPIQSIVHSPKLIRVLNNPLIYLGSKVGISSCTSINQLVDKTKGNSHLKSILVTTISANLRSLYEAWVLCNLINEVGTRLIYPNNGVLHLSQKKVNRGNKYAAIVDTITNQKLAFFIETAIPSKNNVNPKSGGLRPDIVILTLKKDIYESHTIQPIINFNFDNIFSIIECKESISWPWTKKHVYNPLKKTLKKIEVTHLEMLKYYSKVYNYRNFFVISRLDSPQKAIDILKHEKITLLDGVGFDHNKLKLCAKEIEISLNQT